MRLVYTRHNDLIYNSIRFKKLLDIFWPQIQRKRSEGSLLMILAVKRQLWAIFLPWVHLKKIGNNWKPAETINKLMLTWLLSDSWFSETRYITLNTCLREGKLLSLYMFHRIIFILLIVRSSSPLYRRAGCFQSYRNISYVGVLKMPRVNIARL